MKNIKVEVERTTTKDGSFITNGVIQAKVNGGVVDFNEKDIIKAALEIEPFKIHFLWETSLIISSPIEGRKEFIIPELPDITDTKESFSKKLNEFYSFLKEVEDFVKDATSTKEKLVWIVGELK